MKKYLAPALWMLVGFGVGQVMYDSGQRSIVRNCVEFHTFTYGRSAWFCKRMTTAKEHEQDEHPALNDQRLLSL